MDNLTKSAQKRQEQPEKEPVLRGLNTKKLKSEILNTEGELRNLKVITKPLNI